ncbi:MAG: hypothetical protein IT569_06465 [Leptospiraceae bacterium]|nr:hypothetical protein [Leptospiraceae bacterium]
MQTPKPNYIKIDSIEDLDLTKISIAQLSNKYIDKNENRYALRFNMETRKIELIRVQIKSSKTPVPEKAKSADEKIPKIEELPKSKTRSLDEIMAEKLPEQDKKIEIQEDVQALEEEADPVPDSEDVGLHEFDLSIDSKQDSSAPITDESSGSEQNFVMVERNFLAEILKEFEKNKERISAMLNNLKNSKIFDMTGDPSENKNIIGNLSREIDVEVFQNMDKIINFYKELTSYPRPAGYYSSKYDKTRKDILAKIANDKEVMALIIRWEMQDLLLPMHQKLKKLMLDILGIMNTKTESHLKQIQFKEQQMFTDAKNAAIFMSQDIDSVLVRINQWKNKGSI